MGAGSARGSSPSGPVPYREALQRSPTAWLCPTCGVPTVSKIVFIPRHCPLSRYLAQRAGCVRPGREPLTPVSPVVSSPSLTSAPATQRAHLGGRAVPTHPRKVLQHRTLLKTQTQLPRKTCFTRDSRRLQLLVAEISHPLCLSLYLPRPPPPLPLSINSPDTLSSPSSSSSSAGRFHALPPSRRHPRKTSRVLLQRVLRP